MSRRWLPICVILSLLLTSALAFAKADDKEEDEGPYVASTFSGLALRGIGPAIASGRIADIAVQESDHNTWYVGVACGHVWKTVNAGTTWDPIFDNEGSYSVGCVTIDPSDPLIVWVGTGENNSQRSVAYGDGVYKSVDGGKSWENVGLAESEHIGKIVVDPRNSDVVYVAAQGPLWRAGGDRGLYKTTDGGATWELSLQISENTGVNDIIFDPRDPDVLYASAYQRARRVWTLVNGGPESAIYKSTNGGASWDKLKNGLPKVDMGRIGLAISPADPGVLYAIVEAADDEGGFFRSTDAGGNWKKMSDHVAGSPQYYNEIIPDPNVVDRVYSMETWLHATQDGGKTFSKVNVKNKHVDEHAMWIDPDDSDHFLLGCDGGVYESFDRAETWDFKANLPVTQFYKIAVDNDEPFYNVYGGTQDNFTLSGPSRNRTDQGILNRDWIVTVGGDGFQTQADPEDANIVYSQWQHGGLVRFDKRSGEIIDIKPREEKGEAVKWNWDSPLRISPHLHTRLYFAANRLYRSDDRGNSWTAISPDLTRRLDRNRMKIMGRVWSVDAVAKNASTSAYGNIVALSESPKQEGLIYVGTDDGLIQVTEDGGKTWRRIEKFPKVPELTYVSRVEASQHDANVVYAAFNNHKMGDFKPYLLRSDDRGRSWRSIAGDLPERGSVWAIIDDHVDPDLLFAGTEFGVFFSADGGARWVRLEGDMPVVAVRDLVIQRRESDLVVGTFGRGFYILDDYSPLRGMSESVLEKDALLFATKPALRYVPSLPLGLKGKCFQGDSYYAAPNPPFGAVFTYYLKDEIKTRKEARHETEKEAVEENLDTFYPSWDELRAEDREEDPEMLFTITDARGSVVRRITGPVKKGFHRVAWDLRFPPADPTDLEPPSDDNPWADVPIGPLVAPGEYRVQMAKRVDGVVTDLGAPQSFSVVPLGGASFPAADPAALLAFQRKTADLQRAVWGAVKVVGETQKRIDHLKQALQDTPNAAPALGDQVRSLQERLLDLTVQLSGDPVKESRNEPTPPSIVGRVYWIVNGHWQSTADATQTHHQAYDLAAAEFGGVLDQLRTLVETDLAKLEDQAEAAGAPWTPGRLPRWKP